MLINFKFQPRGSKGPDSPSFLKFGGVKVIHKFSDCGGVGTPHPPVLQGSTVYQMLEERLNLEEEI